MQTDRRKKGTGSIVKTNDPRHRRAPWRASFLDNGKRRHKFFAKESEARRFLRDYMDCQNDASVMVVEGITFAGFKDAFLDYKKKHIRPRSFSTLVCNVERAAAYLNDKKLVEIDSAVLQNMVDALSESTYTSYRSQIVREYSKSSIEKAVFAATAMLEYAASQHIIPNVPVINVHYPQKGSFSVNEKAANNNFLSEAEYKAYKAECERTVVGGPYSKNAGKPVPVHPTGYRLLFLLHTGLRLGESLALTWDDYDERSKTIIINKSMATIRGGEGYHRVIQHPKTENSERIIVLNRNALSDIRNLRRTFDEQTIDLESWKANELKKAERSFEGEDLAKEKATINQKYKDYIKNHKYICGSSNFPYGSADAHSLYMTHRKVCETIGLSHHLTIHGLRHTYVTLYYLNHKNDADFDLPTFSRSIGHKDTRTTMTIYAHLKMEENRHKERSDEDLKDF